MHIYIYIYEYIPYVFYAYPFHGITIHMGHTTHVEYSSHFFSKSIIMRLA